MCGSILCNYVCYHNQIMQSHYVLFYLNMLSYLHIIYTIYNIGIGTWHFLRFLRLEGWTDVRHAHLTFSPHPYILHHAPPAKPPRHLLELRLVRGAGKQVHGVGGRGEGSAQQIEAVSGGNHGRDVETGVIVSVASPGRSQQHHVSNPNSFYSYSRMGGEAAEEGVGIRYTAVYLILNAI